MEKNYNILQVIVNFFYNIGAAGGLLSSIIQLINPFKTQTKQSLLYNVKYLLFGLIIGAILHYSFFYNLGILSLFYCFIISLISPYLLHSLNLLLTNLININNLCIINIFLA